MTYYVTCRIGREWYGIPIENVLEVLHLVALNDAPQSSMVGLMTLRERVINVIDLRVHFGISDYEYNLDTPIIAVESNARALGLIVDETDNVIEVDASEAEPYSEEGIEFVLRHSERLIFILDVMHFINLQSVKAHANGAIS